MRGGTIRLHRRTDSLFQGRNIGNARKAHLRQRDRHLFRQLLTHEDLTVGYGGRAPALTRPGLGVTVNPQVLQDVAIREQMAKLQEEIASLKRTTGNTACSNTQVSCFPALGESAVDEESHRGAFGEFGGESGGLIERTFRERIVLVGVTTSGQVPEETEASLDELALLVDTAGADAVDRLHQRRAAPAAPVVVTDSDSSLDVSSTSRSPRPAAPPQADYAAVPPPPVQPRAGSFDDSLSPTSALLREPIVDDRALPVDDAPHLTGPVSSWASLSLLAPGFTA